MIFLHKDGIINQKGIGPEEIDKNFFTEKYRT